MARELAPHAVAFYLRSLAGEFHSYYNAERILVEDEATRMARLALCATVRQVLANGLSLLGVSAPERITFAPSMRMILRRSTEKVSTITATKG